MPRAKRSPGQRVAPRRPKRVAPDPVPPIVASDASGAPRAALFGRDADRARVAAALERGRLVTITGPGGIGKSSLAREVLAGLGVRCALDLASDREGALGAIARAVGVRGTREDPSRSLAAAIAARGTALLLLDDEDAVVDPIARFALDLLAASPSVQVVVTSRD